MNTFLTVLLVVLALVVLLVLGLCRTAADPEPPAVARAVLTPDDPSLPAVAEDVLPADQCSDEEILRRLSTLAAVYDPAPDPRLFDLYPPERNDR